MKIFKIIVILFLFNICHGQIPPKGTIQYKYYNYCNENLSETERLKTYPFYPTEELCSIRKCFRGISYPEINELIYKRIVEIAKVNFDEKNYLYLIKGKECIELAEMKNKNLEDDNKLIYIGIDEIYYDEEVSKGIELYNSETERLMKIKRSR
ncbi:hypothetical protein OIU83_03035 [Flavobacterium sp. LS1R49]|uniref:Uncharacterized protein n=1 Tax=Flavobacterium shii TaxID=2987687 RepID=A0A9X3BXK3_9FLAO|nr:hypothetical protein [Flavobacterium shii]MCV9926606.1 hypothetical protein [Flavobacterium shii]